MKAERVRRAWLSLGSNRGPSARAVRRALAELGRLRGTRLVRASRLARSTPVGRAPLLSRRPARSFSVLARGGRASQPDFVNCCAAVATRLSPVGLLTECKRLEALAGRRPGPRWGPRPLDIDIVLYGALRIRSRLLAVPHPEAARRRFVLAGLAELAPRLRWPGTGRTVASLLAGLKAPSQNVTLIESRLHRSSRHG